MNMTTRQPSVPAIETHIGTRQSGRKLTRLTLCSIRSTTLSIRYVMRKKSVIKGASALRSRSRIAAKTISPVTSMALRGSPFWVSCLTQPLAGTMRCSPIAWRMRPAPTAEASAEEKHAPSSPATTAGGQAAFSIMT